MTSNEGKQVANQLHRQAELVEQAARYIRELADRAAEDRAGNVDEGLGYHYLVDRALREIITAMNNISFGEAFYAAAVADQAEEKR